MITYSYKDFDGIIHYLNVHLDKTDDELNIQKMETIKAKYAQFFIGFTNYYNIYLYNKLEFYQLQFQF